MSLDKVGLASVRARVLEVLARIERQKLFSIFPLLFPCQPNLSHRSLAQDKKLYCVCSMELKLSKYFKMAVKIYTMEARELSTPILILTPVKWILADLVPPNEAQYQSRERESWS